jgi:hypothetical protein
MPSPAQAAQPYIAASNSMWGRESAGESSLFLDLRICGRLYRVIALDGFEMNEPADGQPMLVALSLIDHRVDTLGEDFPCLHDDRPIMLLL